MKMSTIEKVQEDVLVEEQIGINNEIVLYNDDVNTFDHVIDRRTEEELQDLYSVFNFKKRARTWQ